MPRCSNGEIHEPLPNTNSALVSVIGRANEVSSKATGNRLDIKMKRLPSLLAATIALYSTVASAQASSTGSSNTPPADQTSTTTATSDPATEEARRLFEAGVAALQDERYADALSLFEQSYRIRRSASVVLNMGISLRALGRLVEARQRFQEFRELASPALRERFDRDVTGYLADIDRRLGHLRITRLEPPNAIVTIDNRRVTLDSNNETLVDPGERRIEAEAPGYTNFRQTVRIDTGSRVEIPIVLQPVPRTDARAELTARERTTQATEQPVTSQWWFWTGVGLVAAAAVIVPIAIVATAEEPLPPPEIVVFAIRAIP